MESDLGINCAPSTNFLLYFETVPTLWFFLYINRAS